MRFSTLAVAVVMSSTLPTAAFAAGLGPQKPSDIVTLTTTSGHTGCADDQYVVDARIPSDGGSSVPFEIPEGKVLVITSVGYYGHSATGHRYQYKLSAPVNSIVVDDAGTPDSGGQVIGSVTIPTGTVVRPGVALCSSTRNPDLGLPEAPAHARVHGYLAKDK